VFQNSLQSADYEHVDRLEFPIATLVMYKRVIELPRWATLSQSTCRSAFEASSNLGANSLVVWDNVGIPFLPLALHCCAAIADKLIRIVAFSQLNRLMILLQYGIAEDVADLQWHSPEDVVIMPASRGTEIRCTGASRLPESCMETWANSESASCVCCSASSFVTLAVVTVQSSRVAYIRPVDSDPTTTLSI
jgi:hypothetical protein